MLLTLLVPCLGTTGALAAEIEDLYWDPPTPLALQDIHGRQHELGDTVGSVVLVSFWTTWCPPCLKEMPSLQRLGSMLANDGLEVLAVNVGESRERVRRFRGLPAEPIDVLLDRGGDNARLWGVQAYPTAFLLNREGRIVMRIAGRVDWEDEMLVEPIRAELALAKASLADNRLDDRERAE
ncbi:MAG: TlpA family protein disulfide reductase [Gammaproteobacteria bacterium]|nr:TlpA family protein disulfide reductase [Gammaproteobacteria bacterium]